MALAAFTDVSTADDLSADIAAIDKDSQAGAGNGTAYSITLRPGATLSESADLTAINLNGADTLVINGGPTGATLDGANLHRGFFVYQGAVTIENLTIQNAVAQGGSGGAGGGGGGGGLGGGLFVANDPAHNGLPSAVTLVNVTFAHDQAVGGTGGVEGYGFGGGGGLGGVGGDDKLPSSDAGSGGGGGIGGGAAGADPHKLGSPGSVAGAQGGGSGSGVSGQMGGADGGGGGGVVGFDDGAGGGGVDKGGDGGFGGGGGSGTFTGGDGGFGGGGAGSGTPGTGGFGGGDGGDEGDEAGGGGLGAGGDVFVMDGASLTISGGKLSGGSVTGGTSPVASSDGSAFGSGIFIQGYDSVTFGTGATAGQVTEIDDVIDDQSRAGGNGQVIIDGDGIVRFKGQNTYSGGTLLKSGTLDLEAVGGSGGAGTGGFSDQGRIMFAPNANATLMLGSSSFASGYYNAELDDFDVGDTIDLRGFQYVAGQTTATFGVAYLTVSNGARSVLIRMSTEGTNFVTQDDGARGTDVMLVCFAAGTLIRTAWGDVPVEDLMVGDPVVTASSAERPVAWTSHRTIENPGPEACPVRVRAGAFGPGLPERDLYLSPGHPVLVGADANGAGGHLVPIMCLINGTSIARVKVERVTYWHVELDAHDILLAEGLAAESYIDLGSRAWFDGADGALYDPDMALPGMPGRCRPVAIDGPLVEAERRRLDAVFAMRLAGACAWPDDASLGFG